jgi:hypothetical protein
VSTYAAWTEKDGPHSAFLDDAELINLYDLNEQGVLSIDSIEDDDDYDDETFSYGQY